MEQLFIIECGIKRRAEKVVCECCKSEFIRRKGRKTRFCSHDCSAKAAKHEIEIICSNCGCKAFKKPSQIKAAKHGYYFCSKQCKDFAQSLEGNIDAIRPDHYGKSNGQGAVQSFFKKNADKGCTCGEKRKYLLMVHHQDGNRKNNVYTNFEIVCGSCHMKRHLKIVQGEWMYDPSSLTPRNLLINL